MEELKKKLAKYEQGKELFAAIDILEQLIEADPENRDYQLRLAYMLVETGRVGRAEEILQKHLQDDAENRWLLLNLGHVQKALGKKDAAVERYLEVAEDEDDAVSAVGFWSLANMRVFKFDDRYLTLLRDRVQHSDIGSPARGLMLFALAAAWEQRQNHEAAFMAMSEANLIFAAQRPFRGDLFGQMIKSMCEGVQEPSTLPAQDGPTPIFILGMPRSGTTLVEQILAAHSEVEATDELPFLNRIGLDLEKNGGYAQALSSMDAELQRQLAAEYLGKVERYRIHGKAFFIDKMPSNFLHIGLIKSLFPNARIINVVRDPLDNAIGVFKMYFATGAEYSFSMEGIIYHWQGYITLMKHWDKLYPGELMHLSYEDLARNPDAKIAEILDYCGLAMEDSCLRFYESEQPVLTPSAGQVRSPISAKSIGGGQKYEKYLKTSIPALAEIKRVSREVFGIS